MSVVIPYTASFTREQFMFYEMRITAQLMLDGKTDVEIIEEVLNNNLFQYPTEKSSKRMTRACLKRLKILDNTQLIDIIANGAYDSSKQVCLLAMMKQYRVINEFFITVIGEKYRLKDFSLSKRDLNIYFSRIQEQDDKVASWSVSTISKLKQVLLKLLVDIGYLDNTKSEKLNYVLIDFNLKHILIDNKDYATLSAFNCFEENVYE